MNIFYSGVSFDFYVLLYYLQPFNFQHRLIFGLKMSSAIPVYEMVLKSNEDLVAVSQVIRLSENETADVKCKIYDSGFEADSLSLLENEKPIKNDRNTNSITYRIKGSKSEKHFSCTAKRVNGNYQTRKMEVIPRLSRELRDDEIPCTTKKCFNNGMCVYREGLETSQYCMYVLSLFLI